MNKSTVRATVPGICLVGCGSWGGVHALQMKRLGKNIRRYFASRDQASARCFVRRFHGEDSFGSLDAVIADPRVDGVILALPHHLHADAAQSALKAGKHVLVEKPIALSMVEGRQLLQVANESQGCLAVAEQYRLSPLVKKAGELLKQESFGRTIIVNAGMATRFDPAQTWKLARARMGGGVMMDVGIHYINVLRLWFGDPQLVWATNPPRLKSAFEGEDSIVVTFKFADSVVANLILSWSGVRTPNAANFEVIGEHAALELCFNTNYLTLTTPLPDLHWAERIRRGVPWRLREMFESRLPYARKQRFRVPHGDLIGSRALIDDFILAVRGRKSPATSAAEGLKDLRAVEAAYRSLDSGGPVPC